MRTAIVQTNCSRQTLLQLEMGGMFHKFNQKNQSEPLLGEYKFYDRLMDSNKGSEADIDMMQVIDQSHAVIKILGYNFEPMTGNLKVHYDFLPGCSSLERAYSEKKEKFKFVLRLLSMDYQNHKFYKVVTVDLEEGY